MRGRPALHQVDDHLFGTRATTIVETLLRESHWPQERGRPADARDVAVCSATKIFVP